MPKTLYRNIALNNLDARNINTTTLNGEPLSVDPEGPAGPTGPAGPAGPAGHDGVDGRDGRDGVDGRDGRDGCCTGGGCGSDGCAGPTGPTGPSGSGARESKTYEQNRDRIEIKNNKFPPSGNVAPENTQEVTRTAYKDFLGAYRPSQAGNNNQVYNLSTIEVFNASPLVDQYVIDSFDGYRIRFASAISPPIADKDYLYFCCPILVPDSPDGYGMLGDGAVGYSFIGSLGDLFGGNNTTIVEPAVVFKADRKTGEIVLRYRLCDLASVETPDVLGSANNTKSVSYAYDGLGRDICRGPMSLYIDPDTDETSLYLICGGHKHPGYFKLDSNLNQHYFQYVYPGSETNDKGLHPYEYSDSGIVLPSWANDYPNEPFEEIPLPRGLKWEYMIRQVIVLPDKRPNAVGNGPLVILSDAVSTVYYFYQSHDFSQVLSDAALGKVQCFKDKGHTAEFLWNVRDGPKSFDTNKTLGDLVLHNESPFNTVDNNYQIRALVNEHTKAITTTANGVTAGPTVLADPNAVMTAGGWVDADHWQRTIASVSYPPTVHTTADALTYRTAGGSLVLWSQSDVYPGVTGGPSSVFPPAVTSDFPGQTPVQASALNSFAVYKKYPKLTDPVTGITGVTNYGGITGYPNLSGLTACNGSLSSTGDEYIYGYKFVNQQNNTYYVAPGGPNCQTGTTGGGKYLVARFKPKDNLVWARKDDHVIVSWDVGAGDTANHYQGLDWYGRYKRDLTLDPLIKLGEDIPFKMRSGSSQVDYNKSPGDPTLKPNDTAPPIAIYEQAPQIGMGFGKAFTPMVYKFEYKESGLFSTGLTGNWVKMTVALNTDPRIYYYTFYPGGRSLSGYMKFTDGSYPFTGTSLLELIQDKVAAGGNIGSSISTGAATQYIVPGWHFLDMGGVGIDISSPDNQYNIDVSNGYVLNQFIRPAPFLKTLKVKDPNFQSYTWDVKKYELSEFNYGGGGLYSCFSYDEETDYLFMGSANGVFMPYSDMTKQFLYMQKQIATVFRLKMYQETPGDYTLRPVTADGRNVTGATDGGFGSTAVTMDDPQFLSYFYNSRINGMDDFISVHFRFRQETVPAPNLLSSITGGPPGYHDDDATVYSKQIRHSNMVTDSCTQGELELYVQLDATSGTHAPGIIHKVKADGLYVTGALGEFKFNDDNTNIPVIEFKNIDVRHKNDNAGLLDAYRNDPTKTSPRNRAAISNAVFGIDMTKTSFPDKTNRKADTAVSLMGMYDWTNHAQSYGTIFSVFVTGVPDSTLPYYCSAGYNADTNACIITKKGAIIAGKRLMIASTKCRDFVLDLDVLTDTEPPLLSKTMRSDTIIWCNYQVNTFAGLQWYGMAFDDQYQGTRYFFRVSAAGGNDGVFMPNKTTDNRYGPDSPLKGGIGHTASMIYTGAGGSDGNPTLYVNRTRAVYAMDMRWNLNYLTSGTGKYNAAGEVGRISTQRNWGAWRYNFRSRVSGYYTASISLYGEYIVFGPRGEDYVVLINILTGEETKRFGVRGGIEYGGSLIINGVMYCIPGSNNNCSKNNSACEHLLMFTPYGM